MPPLPAVQQHPGNDYYVNPVTHSIQRQSNRLLAYAAGFILGPYDWGNAQAAVVGAKVGAQQAPSGTNALGTVQGAASAVNLGGLAAIGDFFNRLTQGNTWLRVGEVAAGLLILYIGLKATTAQTPIGNAAKSAAAPVKKVAKAAGTAAIAA
jgi:threonine/homoserine/homoserine lactone efflux protein